MKQPKKETTEAFLTPEGSKTSIYGRRKWSITYKKGTFLCHRRPGRMLWDT